MERSELIATMQAHDWWYYMSDDHRVFMDGSRTHARILEGLKLVDREDAKVIWIKYAPSKMKFPL